MKLRNKKGFMRMVEATIGIVIILGVLIVLSPPRNVVQEEDISETIYVLLEEIAQDKSLRQEILGSDEEIVEENLANDILLRLDKRYLDGSVEICEIEEPCFLEPFPETEGEVIAVERMIGASIRETNFSPKKVKVFIWRKEGF